MKQVHGMIGIIMILLLTIMVPQVQAAKSAKECSCVTYVKAKIGTSAAVGNAKDMGSWLKRND